MKLKPHEIHAALGTLINRIERCGASSELTDAVTLTSDLRQAVGNRWNPADDYAAKRVLDAVGPVDPETAAPDHELSALVNHGVLYSDCEPEELPAAVKIADAASELSNREGWTREQNERVPPGILRADRAPGIVRKNDQREGPPDSGPSQHQKGN